MEPEELVGEWRTSAYYSPGSQGDRWLGLRAGGWGEVAELTPLSSVTSTLEWSLDGDRLRLTGVEAWYEQSHPYEHRRTEADLADTVTVRIAEERRPLGLVRALHLELPQGRHPWLAPVYGSPIS